MVRMHGLGGGLTAQRVVKLSRHDQQKVSTSGQYVYVETRGDRALYRIHDVLIGTVHVASVFLAALKSNALILQCLEI